MSASGVDKTMLEVPGRDILLVSGYDSENGRMMLSVPPDVEPRRVSVDAIEHWMIYREHPNVGAIVHVHAWVDGIQATDVNYPCGTEELARSVAELVRQAPDPDHAIVGLRNHGITVTGPSLERDPRPHRAERSPRDPDELAGTRDLRPGLADRLAAHELVENSTDCCPDRGSDQVHPEGCRPAGENRRPQRARGVHRPTRDRTADEDVDCHRRADRDCGCLSDGTGVGGDGHHHEHQDRGQHDLPRESSPLGPGWQVPSDVTAGPKTSPEHSCRGDRADELGGPVADDPACGEMACQRERERDGRVDMRTGDVADRIDDGSDSEP